MAIIPTDDNRQSLPSQETTSVYFNNILRSDVHPLTVDDVPPKVLDDFNHQIQLAFGPEGDDVVRRVRYLVPYILQSIDWNEYGIPLEAWQLQYYYRRERFLQKTGLSYDAFMEHQPLQNAIEALGLAPEPTFEFILFLKYYFGMRSELRFSSLEQLEAARRALGELDADGTASIDINVNGRHFKISNALFVKSALALIDCNRLRTGNFVNDFTEGSARDKIRAIDYYIVKTLLDYLPMHTRSTRGGRFTQSERNFCLSVLSFLGRLPDVYRDEVCGKYNNVTFDKLMRDFGTSRIPFAMELFL